MRQTDSLNLAELGCRADSGDRSAAASRWRAELLARCRRLENALAESEHRYYDLAESLPQTIYEIDSDLNLKYCNAHGLKILGYTLEDLTQGFNVLSTFAPQDHARIKSNIYKILNGEKILGQEYRAVRSDGTTFPVMIFSSPITRANQTVGLRGIIIDISERKRYEEALRLSEEKYRTLFDQKLDGVVVIDENLAILLANAAAADILGYAAADELSGLNLLESIAADGEIEFHHWIKDIFANNVKQNCEIHCHKKSGAEIWIALICNRINYQGKRAGLASFRDITNQKQIDEDLRRSKIEIQNLYAHSHMIREEERNLISHEIHDELGQALTALQIDLYWLQKRLVGNNHEVREKAKAMSALISESISAVQRICSKLSPPILDELGIIAALEWQLSEFGRHFDIRWQFHSQTRELEINRECSIAIFRIVQEALTNVARHAKASKVSLNIEKRNGHLVVRVVDNGKGITHSQIASSYSYGLMGMKERALAFGGEFAIKPGRNGGTLLQFSIPVERFGADTDEEDPGR
jgi:PAS domain S-box-containing protein